MNINSLVDGKFSTRTKAVIILIFLIVPFISSVVSMIHVVRFLGLGNTDPISVTLAITYEIANMTILMAVVLMKKLRAFFVWTCFIVLLFVQIIGNVYYSYDYILIKIVADPAYLKTFISFIKQMMDFEDTSGVVFLLSCFLGLPIPMVSLLLVKSVVDYLQSEEADKQIKEVKATLEMRENIAESVIISQEKPIDEVRETVNVAPITEEVIHILKSEGSEALEQSGEEIHKEINHIGIELHPDEDNRSGT